MTTTIRVAGVVRADWWQRWSRKRQPMWRKGTVELEVQAPNGLLTTYELRTGDCLVIE